MFNGRSRQDLSQTNLTDARDIFREPGPKVPQKNQGEKLAETPQTPERDLLLSQYFGIVEAIEKFLSEHHDKRVTTLEQQRADLWAKCRTAEGAVRSAVVELGRLNSQINSQSGEVNTWRSKATDAAIRPFDTQFPSADEINDWNAKRAAVGVELARHEERLQDLRRESQFAELKRHRAAEELAGLIEHL